MSVFFRPHGLAIAFQGPLSMGFSRQEYWSGLPFPSLRDLPDPGIEPASLTSPALTCGFFTTAPPGESTGRSSQRSQERGGCHLLKVMLSITTFLQASPWSCPSEALRPCGQGLGEFLKHPGPQIHTVLMHRETREALKIHDQKKYGYGLRKTHYWRFAAEETINQSNDP